MKKPSLLIVFAAAVPLFLGVVATLVLVTMPPTPDPDSIPSQVLEPPSPAYGEAVEEGRAIARALIADEKLPGLSLAVAIDGDIIWAEGFRWANMEQQTPVTPETLFRIGRISATLTATAVGDCCRNAAL